MFCRFHGLTLVWSNSHMRFFVMQNKALATRLSRLALSAGAGLLAIAVPTASIAAGTAEEIGLWYDDTGEGAVRIEPCGNSLCGKIVWLKDPAHDDGTPLIDRHNPDASKQKRTICGLQILGDLKPSPEGGFDGGWVYDPKDGKSYSLAISLGGKDVLNITGYLGVKFLGQTMKWTRSKTELPSCVAQPTAAPVEPKAVKPAQSAAGNAVAPAASAAALAAPAVAKLAAPAVAKLAAPAVAKLAAPAIAKLAAPAIAKLAAPAIAKLAAPAIAKPATAAAAPVKPATTTAATKSATANAKTAATKKAATAEVLPWNDAKPAANSSKLGASGVKPAAKKKPKPPADDVTQQRPGTASQQ